MKISINYLKKFVDINDLSAQQIADAITLAGLEVEGLTPLAQGSNLVIGYVLEEKSHPDSDHLHVCLVDTGNDQRQIVCGAPNVAKGQKVIVALPGSELPAKGITIQKSVVRGQESNGMICSLAELGVAEDTLTSAQKEGIEVLAQDAPIGHENPLNYLGLDDYILEFKPTPNRGDSLALIPLFKDIAAILNRSFKAPEIQAIKGQGTSLTVGRLAPKSPIFRVRKVTGVKVIDSPSWLKDILVASGYRPVNSIVDIGNYVMLMTGQPLHMYDAKKLKTSIFTVNDEMTGEFAALDGKKYLIEKGDLIVCNGDDLVGIAGVMGSQSTMIDEQTTSVVIEAALFDAVQIRKTVRRTQLFSDASARFIRGFDGTVGNDALHLATQLLKEIGGFTTVEEIVTGGTYAPAQKVIELPYNRLNKRLGTAFTAQEIQSVFTRLSWQFEALPQSLTVTVPLYRPDVTLWEDLSEEVIRILGFSHLITRELPSTAVGSLSDGQKKRRMIRDYLLSLGLYETINYSLVDANTLADLAWSSLSQPWELMMPMSDDHRFLRMSTLPSLIERIKYNQARQMTDVALYEISTLYTHKEAVEMIGVAVSGAFQQSAWLGAKPVDFYTLKGIQEGIFALLGIDSSRYSYEVVPATLTGYHPGQSALISIGKTKLGVIGVVHPTLAKRYDIKSTVVMELNLTELLKLKSSKTRFVAPPTFPSVQRDLALVVPLQVSAAQLTKTIKKAGKALVTDVEVFDVYRGEHVTEGFQSVAVTITYRHPSKTLVDAEVTALEQEILRALSTECSATLRQ